MSLNLRIVLTSFAFCALLGSTAANGETVLKLSLGSTGADLEMVPIGPDFVIRTVSDGIGGTTGDQNTAIDYTGFLSSNADVTTNTASFSVAGLKRTGPPNIIGGTVIVQDFTGGSFDLYSPTNGLLLHGDLTESTLTGVIGSSGTGSIFTTKVGNFTSGSLLPDLVPNSLNVSMALTNVNGGNGFVVSGAPFALLPFTTDASVNISADQRIIPEPTSIAIALLGAAGFGLVGRRRA
jgi:PEP-CTERM motif-containing protein